MSNKEYNQRLKINEGIRAPELRVLQDNQESELMSRDEALQRAQDLGLDLIEISAKANPPVARITDYGRFVYDQKKKQKEIKANQHMVEVKNIQIKAGTGAADLALKAKKASQWLSEGHRVKAELYLRGRAKYMDKEFLHGKLHTALSLIMVPYKLVEDVKQSPKGLAILIEPDKKAIEEKKKQEEKNIETKIKSSEENTQE